MTPQRIQRRRTRGWKMPPGALYVGRPTVFGNPWSVSGVTVEGPGWFFQTAYDGFDDGIDDAIGEAHEFAVQLYRSWLDLGSEAPVLKGRPPAEQRPLEAKRASILGQLHILAGHDLACWCPEGLACHSDLLIELANA